MTIKLLPVATLAIATLGSAALADGFYFSGSLQGTTQDHGIERNTAGFELPVPDVGGSSYVSATDAALGIAAGYEFDLGSNFFIGAEAFYNFENAGSRNINGVLVTDVSLESTYGVRLISGVDVTDKFSVYAHAGVTEAEFDVRNSYTFADPVRSGSFSETGFSYGVGASYAVTDRMSIFTELTQVDGIEFDGLPEVAGGTARENPNSLDLAKTAIGVKFNF